jgi:hypothetical protein
MKYHYFLFLILLSACSKTDVAPIKTENIVIKETSVVTSDEFSPVDTTTSYFWEYKNFNNGQYYDVLASCLPLIQKTISGFTTSNAHMQLDFDNDGLMDLVIQSTNYDEYNDDSIFVVHNDGNGKYSIKYSFVGVEQGRRAIVNDFDKNGYPDVIIVGTPGERPKDPTLNMNDPKRYQVPIHLRFFKDKMEATYLNDFKGYNHTITSGDINGDGYADIIAPNFFNNGNAVGINDGKGNFIKQSSPFNITTNERTWVELFDIDGDNKLDLFLASSGNETTKVYYGNGSMNEFPNIQDYGITYSFQFKDLNGDKKKDVILNRIKHQNNPYDGYKLQFLIKDTVGYKDVSSIYISNQWQKLVGDANNPPKWFDYLDQIDMNGDGFRDLVAGRASYDSKGLVNGPPIYQVPVWLWDKQTKTYKDTLITKMR